MPIMHSWHHQDYIAAAGALIQAVLGAVVGIYIFAQQITKSKEDKERQALAEKRENRRGLVGQFDYLTHDLLAIVQSCPATNNDHYKIWQSQVQHTINKMRDISKDIAVLFSEAQAEEYLEKFKAFSSYVLNTRINIAAPEILPRSKEITDMLTLWCR